MKRLLLVTTTCLAIFAIPVHSQTLHATLDLYADEAGTECNIVDTPGIVFVHMIVVGTGSIEAIAIGAPKPGCWLGATYLGDGSGYDGMAGSSQLLEDVGPLNVLFGDCLPLPVYVGFVLYSSQGTAETCCSYPVFGGYFHSMTRLPHVVECGALGATEINAGDGLIINGDDTCPCMMPIPVEETSWGRVKSLYQ